MPKAPAATDNRLTWFDRTGKPLGTVGGVAKNHLPRISPDGSHIVVPRFDNQGGSDIFVIDVARDVSTRITSDGGSTLSIWADGSNIVFVSRRSAPTTELVERSVTGDKNAVLLSAPQGMTPTGISADGKYLLLDQGNAKVLALPLSGERTPIPVVTTVGRSDGVMFAGGAAFSPDGHRVAYYTQDADDAQVYVTTFPPSGQRIKLSSPTGYWPQWSKDGKRVIYVTEDWHFMEVSVPVLNGTIRPGRPTELFVQRQDTPGWHSFAFDPVKERFLIPVGARTSPSEPLTVVLNWMTELTKR